ncbi:MAG: DUF6814 family protein [Chitinophagaceae bacterium]
MNTIKRYLGIVWMILGPSAIYILLKMGLHEMQVKPTVDTIIQWSVFIIIFIPIFTGLFIFGYFAIKGEYDHLPESSAEIED